MSSFLPGTSYNFELQAAAASGNGFVGNEVSFARDPTTQDLSGPSGGFNIGQQWWSTSSNTLWILQSVSGGSATWVSTGAIASPVTVPNGGTGDITLTAHGVLIGEGAAAVQVTAAGTNGQLLCGSTGANPAFTTLTSSDSSISFTTGAHTLDLTASLTADFASPPPIGSVAPNTAAFTLLGANSTTTLAALDQTGTTNINTSGAGVTTIGTGGTGATKIGNATGNTQVTGTLTASTGLAATTGNVAATAGSVTAGAAVSATTTVTGGTGVSATTGNITAVAGNISATVGSVSAGTTVTGGTGVTATTGNITASAGAVSAFSTVTGGTGVIATTGNVSATAGQVNAGTSMTATLGDITATNGNLVLAHAGNKLLIHASTAANDSVGTATLGAGGTVTVSTTAVTATSLIFLSYNNCTSALAAALSYGTIMAGVSFVISSQDATDATSTVNYWIIN